MGVHGGNGRGLVRQREQPSPLSLLDALARGIVPAVAAAIAGRWVSQQLAFDSVGMAVLTAAITGAVVVIVFVGLARLFRFAEANPKEWRRKLPTRCEPQRGAGPR